MEASTDAATRTLHERLLADRRIQFDFQSLDIPRQHLPKWLLSILAWIGKAFVAALPVLQVVFWVGLAAGLLAVLYLILREALGVRLPTWDRRRAADHLAPMDFAPDRRRALALIEDADRLAADGRFDEAARLILRRSIEDIDARRPRLVRPALTAREIADLGEVPAPARGAFSAMAAIVEVSAFAGRRLDRQAFLDCRTIYQRFAFPEAWA
jgi:hypothetical protein